MISKLLEAELAVLAGRPTSELTQRFQKARDCNLLPKDRGQHAQPLALEQIARAILCLVPARPASAGLQGMALANLRPVGGPAASFYQAETLEAAVAAAIEHPGDVLELTVLDGDFGTNAYGYACIKHCRGEAHFVHRNDRMALQRGAERTFNPLASSPDISIQRQIVFRRKVFDVIRRRVAEARERRHIEAKLMDLARSMG